MISISQHDPAQHQAWLQKSCDYIRALYHPAENSHGFKLAELLLGRFFLVQHHASIVGCGTMVPYAAGVVELKHIFLDAAARGLGCGRALLTHMEQIAQQDSVLTILLETGDRQPEACGLYRAFGYQLCPPYIVQPLPHAIFMAKSLA